MFDIRVICAPDDTDHVVAALDRTFNTGTITVYPSRDGKQNRLYLRVDHKQAPAESLTDRADVTAAYATAPDARTELDWLCSRDLHERDRVWWLRCAAVVDRMAAGLAPGCVTTPEHALELALALIGQDCAVVTCDPRTYVRRQYAHWAKNH